MAFDPVQLIDDDKTDAGDVVSVEIFQTLANNCNYFIDSMPIGTILPVMVGLPGCPIPDPLYWQECDGSTITNEFSDLRDNPTPDYSAATGRYMRGYVTAGTIGNYGGSNTKTLAHSHTGFTGDFVKGTDNAQDDTDFVTVQTHKHGISSDLSTHNFEPEHVIVKHYIKIA